MLKCQKILIGALLLFMLDRDELTAFQFLYSVNDIHAYHYHYNQKI